MKKNLLSYLFILISCLSLNSCQTEKAQIDFQETVIDFLSNNSWGKFKFNLPADFQAINDCQLLWSDAFLIRCFESEFGQLEIIISENNTQILKTIDDEALQSKLDSLQQSHPELEVIKVTKNSAKREEVLQLEYLDNGEQKKGYHLERIIGSPYNKVVVRFYSNSVNAEQMKILHSIYNTIKISSNQK